MHITFVEAVSGSYLGTRPVTIDAGNPVPRKGDAIKLVGSDGEFTVTKVVWAYDVGIVYVHLAR